MGRKNLDKALSIKEGYWYTVNPNSMLVVLYQRISGQNGIHERKTITQKEALHQWYRPGSQESACILMSIQLHSSSPMFQYNNHLLL